MDLLTTQMELRHLFEVKGLHQEVGCVKNRPRCSKEGPFVIFSQGAIAADNSTFVSTRLQPPLLTQRQCFLATTFWKMLTMAPTWFLLERSQKSWPDVVWCVSSDVRSFYHSIAFNTHTTHSQIHGGRSLRSRISSPTRCAQLWAVTWRLLWCKISSNDPNMQ